MSFLLLFLFSFHLILYFISALLNQQNVLVTGNNNVHCEGVNMSLVSLCVAGRSMVACDLCLSAVWIPGWV